jgi:RIO kinase 1
MSSDTFLKDKELKKLDRKIQKLIDKEGIDKKTQDEVFDKYTLSTIEKLFSDKVLKLIDFPISTGKEGNVFRAITPKNEIVAVKIYRTSNATFRHISEYIFGDPRFTSIKNTRKDLVFAWTKKEYKNLERLKKVKVRAPKPIIFSKNILVMQYIGNKKESAPLLKNVELSNPQKVFNELITFIKKMYKKAELVHGDLSAFNILYFQNKPYLIDLGQGVLIEHPKAQEFLRRDIHNIVHYFKKYKIKADEKDIFENIISKE